MQDYNDAKILLLIDKVTKFLGLLSRDDKKSQLKFRFPKSRKGTKAKGPMQHTYLYASLVYLVNESFNAAK